MSRWSDTDNTYWWDREDDMSAELTMEEACDQVYQEFMDWARGANPRILLYDVARLIEGHRDPYSMTEDRQARYLNLQAMVGWSGVLEKVAQIQREREDAA